MSAAVALSDRTRGRTAPNPNVGCVIVRDGRVVGRGWTQVGGRPHGEAVALAQAAEKSRGATVFTTLEPCAHVSARGPACADLLIAGGVARVVVALVDPDPRTTGRGIDRLRAAGIEVVTGVQADAARRTMAGFLTRQGLGRPFVTLKLATSLDGCIALNSGESRWITGPAARAHAHLERARHEAILVGRGTYEVDAPKLDVRLAGLEDRSPRKLILSCRPGASRGRHVVKDRALPLAAPASAGATDWGVIETPDAIATLSNVDHVLVEGGAQTAAAFLRAKLVDRLLLYRAPIVVGGGLAALGDIGLTDLAAAHGRWTLADARQLGSDWIEVYEARACSPE